MEQLPSRLIGALVMLLAIAVVARVVFGLLWSLLPGLVVLLVLIWVTGHAVRGPRSSGGLFHK